MAKTDKKAGGRLRYPRSPKNFIELGVPGFMKQKSNFLYIAGLLSLILVSCNKPPRAPDFNGSKHSGTGDSDPDSDGGGEGDVEDDDDNGVKGPTGKDLNGKDSNGYTNLVCQNPETHRGIRAWRRLSNVEIVNTVKDVFGANDKLDWSVLLGDIPKKDIFDTVQAKENFMESNRLKGYVKFAENVSANIDINKLFPCKAEAAACITKRIGEVGAQAWRRPLSPEEITSFEKLFGNLLLDGITAEAAFPFVVQGMILSPNFMYRSELGKMNGDGEYELTPYEMASALSYLIWRRPPDAALRDLAAKDMLNTTEAVAALAKKMLADPKAKVAMGDFADMWLDSKKILNVSKGNKMFTDAAKAGMSKEVRDFFIHTMYSDTNSTFKHLLTSNYTTSDAASQFVYGAAPGADGKTMFAQPERRGVLGQAAFLASHTLSDDPNPITRGVFVSERFLCVDFAPPPAVKVPEAMTGLSNKERFRQHSTNPACAGCHVMLDPLGFALENFDVSGVFRTVDQGEKIDINQKLEIDKKDVAIKSPQALSEAIAGSKQGLECFVRQSFRYTLGRMEYSPRIILGASSKHDDTTQSKLDQCQIDKTTAALQKNGGDLKSAIIEMVSSPAFRTRLIGQLPTSAH